MTAPRATSFGPADLSQSFVTLDYGERLLRRKRLTAEDGTVFIVDLAHASHVEPGDAFLLDDGRAIEVRAAEETLLKITGDLPRLAWHIGNRHTPCQMGAGYLLIQFDPVLRDMLTGLGAVLSEITGPFRPEGGAYGHGRTMGHDHDHSHDHEH